MTDRTRGILYPARLPTFHRIEAPTAVAELVRWFWIPEWNLPPGRVSRQLTVSFPASNLVVESGVESGFVGLAGPTTRASHRDLRGRGWAVGALLQPAAVPLFTDDPAALRDEYARIDLPAVAPLHEAVRAAMVSNASPDERRARAVDAFASWLQARCPTIDDEARLANRLAEVIDRDADVIRLEDVAAQLHVSTRTVQRLARRFVGLPPAAMIRRRRLQEAAERLRTDPGADLSEVAAELGYADHAHLTHDFRTALGFTPSAYRQQLPDV